MGYIPLIVKENILYPAGFSTENEPLTPEQISKFYYLIYQAKFAKAYPEQSGFFVRTAGITKKGEMWTGGNKEYGHSDAFIHGETAVVSGLKDLTNDPIEIIAWYREKETGPRDFGRPCGNCRDILRKYCDPNLILLNGNENAVVYTRLKDFLFEDFRKINLDHIETGSVEAALKGLFGGNDIYLPERMKNEPYGVALVSRSGEIWKGGHYTNVGYDSVTPLLSTIISWKNSYPNGAISKRHLELSKVVVVSQSGMPNVFYRDRQAILELDEVLRKFTKSPCPLQVELVHATKDDRGNMIIYEARRTNVEKWLPHPFSPGAFRMDDVMEAQLEKLIGKG